MSRQLSLAGINTVYIAVYGSAKVRWPSKSLTGVDLAMPASQEIFSEGVKILRAEKMRVVPWFEGGLSVYLSQKFAQNNPDLLQRCGKGYKSGEYGGNVMAFLDPKKERALAPILGALKELAEHPLGFDEVQLDRFRYTRGAGRICRSYDGSFDSKNIDVAVKAAYDAIKSVNGNMIVSVSPVTAVGGVIYNQKWTNWANGGYVDSVSGQAYVRPIAVKDCALGHRRTISRRATLLLFKKELSVWERKLNRVGTQFPLAIGIMAQRDDDSECMLDQIRYARSRGFSNFSLWVSKIKPNSDGSANSHIKNNLELLRKTDWGRLP